jgi:hypothetical protein
MVEGGFITDYTAQILAANDANSDGRISADEYAAAQAALSAGFELTTNQATGLETAMTAVTKAVSDPQLFGRELGDRANQILQDMHNGVISVDDAIAQLNALPLDVTFNRAAAAAENAKSSIDSMVDSLYGSATAFGAEAKAIEDTTIALREHKQAVDDAFVATNYSASLPVITQYTGEAKAAAGVTQDLGRAFIEGATAIDPMTQAISDLNTELTDTGAEGLDRYMNMIVGFTDGIVDSTGKAKKWADNLIAPVGVYSELDNLLANGKITLDQYNAAQQAQIDITNDDARAQAARNQIQAEQAPLIAQQSDAAADYIEKLAGMTAGEQELALAYADPAQSKRITDIADMAAGYHDMTDAQKEAFGETVTSAAAADSSLAAVLESLGIIKASTTDPSGWEINMDTVNSQTAMDTLVSTLQDLVTPSRRSTTSTSPHRSIPLASGPPIWHCPTPRRSMSIPTTAAVTGQRRASAPSAGRSTSPPAAWSIWPNSGRRCCAIPPARLAWHTTKATTCPERHACRYRQRHREHAQWWPANRRSILHHRHGLHHPGHA